MRTRSGGLVLDGNREIASMTKETDIGSTKRSLVSAWQRRREMVRASRRVLRVLRIGAGHGDCEMELVQGRDIGG